MKVSEDKIFSGCGEMTAVEVENSGINSEIDTHIEGYEDYYENDLWSIDPTTGKVHLYSMTSEGEAHDHVGEWKDEKPLNSSGGEPLRTKNKKNTYWQSGLAKTTLNSKKSTSHQAEYY